MSKPIYVPGLADEDLPVFHGIVRNPELSDIVKFSAYGCIPTRSELEVMGSLRGSGLYESGLYDEWVKGLKISRGLIGLIAGIGIAGALLMGGVVSFALPSPVIGACTYFLPTPKKFPSQKRLVDDVSRYRTLDLSKLEPPNDVIEFNGFKYGCSYAPEEAFE